MTAVTDGTAVPPVDTEHEVSLPEGLRHDADVIVVGAGPSGSAAAYWLATAGLDVLLLEKTSFPREKVCGDGLTPRGTRALVDMGIDVSEEAGWLHNKGLRVIGGGLRLELDWPELASFPNYGLVRPRADLDHLLVRQAVKAGARLHEQTSVTGPVQNAAGRIVGVTAKAGPDKVETTYRAPVVLACDGVSGRFALALGLERNAKRPMGVAVRRYYTSPRTHDDYLESWLELWDGPPGADDAKLLPGYGWIFGMGDGSVNVGLGVLNSSAGFQKTDYRQLLTRWLDNTPEEWGLREENALGATRGAGAADGLQPHPALPRRRAAGRRLGRLGEPVQRRGHPVRDGVGQVRGRGRRAGAGPPRRPRPRARPGGLPGGDGREWGAYYRLGGVFVKLIGNPAVMRACTRHGLPHPRLMKFVLKLLANLSDPHDGDASDRIITALTRLTPPLR